MDPPPPGWTTAGGVAGKGRGHKNLTPSSTSTPPPPTGALRAADMGQTSGQTATMCLGRGMGGAPGQSPHTNEPVSVLCRTQLDGWRVTDGSWFGGRRLSDAVPCTHHHCVSVGALQKPLIAPSSGPQHAVQLERPPLCPTDGGPSAHTPAPPLQRHGPTPALC